MSMQNNNNSSGYMSWWHMIDRCVNVNSKKYKNYGLRGIKVCDRWLGKEGFINFYNDMGPSTHNHYYNPNIVTPKWASEAYTDIGNHRFLTL